HATRIATTAPNTEYTNRNHGLFESTLHQPFLCESTPAQSGPPVSVGAIDVVDRSATIGSAPMPRRSLPPPLAPRQPKTVLGWSMQKLRLVYGVSVRQTADEFGCSPSHISRVERGDTKPSRALVQFYEERFEADGLLLSLFEVAEHAGEQKR